LERKILILSSIVVTIFFSSILLFYSYSSFQNSSSILKKINISLIHNGDLVLRRGRSTESYAVFLADNNAEFTHVGIISIENKIPFVIHAVPHTNKVIKKELLLTFLDKSNTSQFAIYRTSFGNIDKVVKEAELFYQKKYEFDTEYNLDTDSKLYCTELIQKAFKNAGISLKLKVKEFDYVVGKHNIIFPSEFTKAPIFNRIL